MLGALGMPSAGDARRCGGQARSPLIGHRARHRPLPPLLTAQDRHGDTDRPPRRCCAAGLTGMSSKAEAVVEGRFSGERGTGGWKYCAACRPPRLPPARSWPEHRVTTLAVTPQRCYGVSDAAGSTQGTPVSEPRLWGLGTQLYSLRRPGDGGIGDFGGLARFVRQAARRGAAAVAISPVHAMFADDLHRFSPYGPSSRVLFNALHIDPSAVMGEEALAEVLREHGLARRRRTAGSAGADRLAGILGLEAQGAARDCTGVSCMPAARPRRLPGLPRGTGRHGARTMPASRPCMPGCAARA